jgi:O-antigen biosynthesis protein
MKEDQHILIIGTVWPEPDSSAAGTRMIQLMELFRSNGWKVTFSSAAADSDFMFDLRSAGAEKVSIKLNDESFNDLLKQLKPTVVLFDRFMTEEQFGWRVSENCPEALRIIDTEDLHCLRSARQQLLKEKRKFSFDDLNSDVAKREIASIYRSDLSLIISEFEMKILREHFKVDKTLLHYIPFLFDPIDSIGWHGFVERKNFISIGNFLHEPNFDSVKYLKEEIWPLIRKRLPEAELHVYGAYASQKVNTFHNPKEGFYMKGRAGNAKEVISKARVLLAPLRFGAGLKGKLIDAMLTGTPSVTTDIGAEAMHAEMDWNGIIANTAEEIADAAFKLYTNAELWNKASENGKHIINEVYQKKKHSDTLINRITELQKNLQNHRKKNFIGAMLMHHTISGTKYMSKWIEEKNK